MSRYYGMSVTISRHDPKKVRKIKAAAKGQWPFEDWQGAGEELRAYAEDNLYGGETEEQFAERLAVAVWRANGTYCDVVVDATYLESLPYESHCPTEADYARLIGT
jgi:hypothetical protein